MDPWLFFTLICIAFCVLCCICIICCILWILCALGQIMSNFRDLAASKSANDDFEYGESRDRKAKRIERETDVRYAINGYGALPRGFDHVKISKDLPKGQRERNRYYFYTTMPRDEPTTFDHN